MGLDRLTEQGRNIEASERNNPKWIRFFRGAAWGFSLTTTSLIFACAAVAVLKPELNITGEMAVAYSFFMGSSIGTANGIYSLRS